MDFLRCNLFLFSHANDVVTNLISVAMNVTLMNMFSTPQHPKQPNKWFVGFFGEKRLLVVAKYTKLKNIKNVKGCRDCDAMMVSCRCSFLCQLQVVSRHVNEIQEISFKKLGTELRRG